MNNQYAEIPADALTLSTSSANNVSSSGMGMYIPALLILALIVLDSIVAVISGAPWLSLVQSVLLIGAAILLIIPAAIRYLRESWGSTHGSVRVIEAATGPLVHTLSLYPYIFMFNGIFTNRTQGSR